MDHKNSKAIFLHLTCNAASNEATRITLTPHLRPRFPSPPTCLGDKLGAVSFHHHGNAHNVNPDDPNLRLKPHHEILALIVLLAVCFVLPILSPRLPFPVYFWLSFACNLGLLVTLTLAHRE
jgi:hypothetical protein